MDQETGADAGGRGAVRAPLSDSFGRVRDLVQGITDDLPRSLATYRPDDDANTVAWLLWHLARVQDDHVAELAGVPQVWTSRGWHRRFGLPFDASATGYGQSSDEVAAVVGDAELIAGYHADVHGETLGFIESLPIADLDR